MPLNSNKKSSRKAKILPQFSIPSGNRPLLDLLEIQRKSFFDLLEHGIPHELAKTGIFRETTKNSIFTQELELILNPETYTFISPNSTPKYAILKGKTYACKLYVQATLRIRSQSPHTPTKLFRSCLPSVESPVSVYPYPSFASLMQSTGSPRKKHKYGGSTKLFLPRTKYRAYEVECLLAVRGKHSTGYAKSERNSSISTVEIAQGLGNRSIPQKAYEVENQNYAQMSKACSLPSVGSTLEDSNNRREYVAKLIPNIYAKWIKKGLNKISDLNMDPHSVTEKLQVPSVSKKSSHFNKCDTVTELETLINSRLTKFTRELEITKTGIEFFYQVIRKAEKPRSYGLFELQVFYSSFACYRFPAYAGKKLRYAQHAYPCACKAQHGVEVQLPLWRLNSCLFRKAASFGIRNSLKLRKKEKRTSLEVTPQTLFNSLSKHFFTHLSLSNTRCYLRYISNLPQFLNLNRPPASKVTTIAIKLFHSIILTTSIEQSLLYTNGSILVYPSTSSSKLFRSYLPPLWYARREGNTSTPCTTEDGNDGTGGNGTNNGIAYPLAASIFPRAYEVDVSGDAKDKQEQEWNIAYPSNPLGTKYSFHTVGRRRSIGASYRATDSLRRQGRSTGMHRYGACTYASFASHERTKSSAGTGKHVQGLGSKGMQAILYKGMKLQLNILKASIKGVAGPRFLQNKNAHFGAVWFITPISLGSPQNKKYLKGFDESYQISSISWIAPHYQFIGQGFTYPLLPLPRTVHTCTSSLPTQGIGSTYRGMQSTGNRRKKHRYGGCTYPVLCFARTGHPTDSLRRQGRSTGMEAKQEVKHAQAFPLKWTLIRSEAKPSVPPVQQVEEYTKGYLSQGNTRSVSKVTKRVHFSQQNTSLVDNNNLQIFRPWIYLGELPLMTKRGHFILNGSPRVIVNQIARCPGIYFQEKRRGVGFEQEVRVSADLIPQRGPWLRIQSDWEGRFWARLKQEGRVKYATLYEAFQEFEKQYNAPLVSLIASRSSTFPKSEIIAFQERKTKEDRQKKALTRLFKNSTRYSLGKLGRIRINQRIHFRPLYEFNKLEQNILLPNLSILLLSSLQKLRYDHKKDLMLSDSLKNLTYPFQHSHTLLNEKWNYKSTITTGISHDFSEGEKTREQHLKNTSHFLGTITGLNYIPYSYLSVAKSFFAYPPRRTKYSHPLLPLPRTMHTCASSLRTQGIGSTYRGMQSTGSRRKKYNFYTSADPQLRKPRAVHTRATFGMHRVSTHRGTRPTVCTGHPTVLPIPCVCREEEQVCTGMEAVLRTQEVELPTEGKQDQIFARHLLYTQHIEGNKQYPVGVRRSNGNKTNTFYLSLFFNSRKRKLLKQNAIINVYTGCIGRSYGNSDTGGIASLSKNMEKSEAIPPVLPLPPSVIQMGQVVEPTEEPNSLLMAKDIDAIHVCLERLLEGQGFTDDIDHLKNRFIRTSGKLLQQQFELGLHRLTEVITPLLKNLLQSHFALLKDSGVLPIRRKSKVALRAGGSELPTTMLHSCSSEAKPSSLHTQHTLPAFRLSTESKIHFSGDAQCLALPPALGKVETRRGGSSRTSKTFTSVGKQPNQSRNTPPVTPFRWLRTSKPINGAFREFFGSNPLSQYMDQTNPLAEITHKRRLSSMGPGGIKRETAGMEVRGIHPTHYGRVCPIETPEGKNAGLVNSPTVYGRIGRYGFLETPLYQVRESQVQLKRWAFFSAQQEEDEISSLATCDTGLMKFNLLVHVPIPVQTANNPLAHFQQVERNRVGYKSLSPVQTISIATALIPFLEHDDANRALMGSNMQRQAIPLLLPERPIVGTGFEPLVVVESGQTLQATQLGYVSYINANSIVIHSIPSIGNEVKALPQSVLRNYFDNEFSSALLPKVSPILSVLPSAGQMILAVKRFLFGPLQFEKKPEDAYSLTKQKPLLGVRSTAYPCASSYGICTSYVGGISRMTYVYPSIPELFPTATCAYPCCTSSYGIAQDKHGKLASPERFLPCGAQVWKKLKYGRCASSYKIVGNIGSEPKLTRTRLHLCSSHSALFLTPIKQILQPYQRSNQETCLHQRPLVQEGDWVQRGDFLADCSASHLGDLSLGKNVTVAYMPWEGYNFEDAIVISDRLVSDDVYTSLHIERYEIKVNKNSQGKERITNRIPGISHSLKHLNNFGIARISSWVQPGDILVGKVIELKRPLSPYERLAWELASRLSPASPEREKWLNKVWLEDISLRLPSGICGRVINSQIISTEWSDKEQLAHPLEVHIYLAVKRKIQIGDKLAGRHGNKGIVSTILPQQDMPYLGDGRSIDMVLNPLGVPSRMNLGQIFECLLGLAGSQLGCNFKITPFDEVAGGEASRSLVFLKLYQCRLVYKQQWLFTPTFPGKSKLFDGRTGEPFENWVTVGQAYMLKLIHMVDHKIHARSTGPYSLFTRQPVRGRSRRGGQRLGEMEVWAVEGFGAAYTLQEFLTIKSDDLKARTALQRSFYKQNDITFGTIHISPGNPEAFKVLISELQALCLHIQI